MDSSSGSMDDICDMSAIDAVGNGGVGINLGNGGTGIDLGNGGVGIDVGSGGTGSDVGNGGAGVVVDALVESGGICLSGAVAGRGAICDLVVVVRRGTVGGRGALVAVRAVDVMGPRGTMISSTFMPAVKSSKHLE